MLRLCSLFLMKEDCKIDNTYITCTGTAMSRNPQIAPPSLLMTDELPELPNSDE